MKIRDRLEPEYCYYLGNGIMLISGMLYSSVIIIFFLSHNFNFTQIALTNSIMFATNLLFDYPTGTLADKYGRLKIYCIGALLSAVSVGIFIVGTAHLWLIYFAAAVNGFGSAQLSGTLMPWYISHKNKNTSYDKQMVVGLQYRNQAISMIGGLLVAAFIFYIKLDATIILVVSTLGAAISGLVVYVLFTDNKSKEEVTFTKIHKKTFKQVFTNKFLLVSMILMTTMLINFDVFDLMWQPKIVSFGFNVDSLPLMMAFMGIALFIGSWAANKLPVRKISASVCLLVAVALFTFIFTDSMYLALGAFFLFRIAMGYEEPIVSAFQHEHIDDSVRSSAISLMYSVANIVTVFTQVLIGMCLDSQDKFLLGLLVAASVGVQIVCMAFLVWNYHIKKEDIDSSKFGDTSEVVDRVVVDVGE